MQNYCFKQTEDYDSNANRLLIAPLSVLHIDFLFCWLAIVPYILISDKKVYFEESLYLDIREETPNMETNLGILGLSF